MQSGNKWVRGMKDLKSSFDRQIVLVQFGNPRNVSHPIITNWTACRPLMSNTPELNRTDCKHRRPDSAEVRSRNLLRLTGSRILTEVWEEERPWERGGPEVS